MKDYHKRELWKWLWMLIVGLALIWLVCSLGGCSKISYKGIEYRRWGSQQLDDVLIEIKDPNGTEIGVIIEGQKSEFELALEAAGLGAKIGGGK